jgi:hypothetical protein
MKRRHFSRAILVGLPIVSLMTVIGIDGQWNKSEAQGVGKVLRTKKYKNKDIAIEEGDELDTVVRVKIKGKTKSKDIELLKNKKNNRSVYTTGYFPFGEEFPTVDAALEDIIDLGVLDLD